jgi:catechol 2,3-dioxygenase-like lactoylglutathione lyase family enzyme
MSILVNIDVPDLLRAVAFYTEGLGLRVGRKFDDAFLELLGEGAHFYLLVKPEGSSPNPDGDVPPRTYARHWTPVHLDFVVADVVAARARAIAAGATAEGEISEHAYGRLALMADPFGNGFCLLQFTGRGYDAIATG